MGRGSNTAAARQPQQAPPGMHPAMQFPPRRASSGPAPGMHPPGMHPQQQMPMHQQLQQMPPMQMPAQGGGEYPTVYIVDVPQSFSQQDLVRKINETGYQTKIYLNDTPANGDPLGEIVFRYAAEAEKFYACLNGLFFTDGRLKLTLRNKEQHFTAPYAQTLAIQHLPADMQPAELYDLFRAFGKIISVKTRREKRSDEGSALVQFERQEVAEWVLAEKNGAPLGNSLITLNWHVPKGQQHLMSPGGTPQQQTMTPPRTPSPRHARRGSSTWDGSSGAASTPTTSPKTSNSPASATSGQWTRRSSKNPAGSNSGKWPASASKSSWTYVGKNNKSPHTDKPNFILHNVSAKDSPLDERNLYIKNLPASVDNVDLFNLFRKYGKIVSAKVMKDEQQKSKGFGFVCFESSNHALNARGEMNNVVIDDLKLVVTVAEPKGYRQEKLKNYHAAKKEEEAKADADAEKDAKVDEGKAKKEEDADDEEFKEVKVTKEEDDADKATLKNEDDNEDADDAQVKLEGDEKKETPVEEEVKAQDDAPVAAAEKEDDKEDKVEDKPDEDEADFVIKAKDLMAGMAI